MAVVLRVSVYVCKKMNHVLLHTRFFWERWNGQNEVRRDVGIDCVQVASSLQLSRKEKDLDKEKNV